MTRRSAFTLIELLVVISIIALLISILLPALGSARKTAVQLQCQSQIRSIGQAVHMYLTDHSQYFPYGVNLTGGTYDYFNDTLNSYLGLGSELDDTLDAELWHDTVLWPETGGDGNWALYVCNPNVFGAVNSDGNYYGSAHAPYGADSNQNAKESDVPVSPSNYVLFADGYRPMSWWPQKIMLSNYTTSSYLVMPHFSRGEIQLVGTSPYGGDQIADGGTGSTLYLDGHVRGVEAVEWPNAWGDTGTEHDFWTLPE